MDQKKTVERFLLTPPERGHTEACFSTGTRRCRTSCASHSCWREGQNHTVAVPVGSRSLDDVDAVAQTKHLLPGGRKGKERKHRAAIRFVSAFNGGRHHSLYCRRAQWGRKQHLHQERRNERGGAQRTPDSRTDIIRYRVPFLGRLLDCWTHDTCLSPNTCHWQAHKYAQDATIT